MTGLGSPSGSRTRKFKAARRLAPAVSRMQITECKLPIEHYPKSRRSSRVLQPCPFQLCSAVQGFVKQGFVKQGFVKRGFVKQGYMRGSALTRARRAQSRQRVRGSSTPGWLQRGGDGYILLEVGGACNFHFREAVVPCGWCVVVEVHAGGQAQHSTARHSHMPTHWPTHRMRWSRSAPQSVPRSFCAPKM